MFTLLFPLGVYLLNVLWAGKQVKGCPLKVSIRPRCDAGRVLCSGEGLKGGGLGEKLKVFIDTKRAGPGELSAHCSGPHKVAHCELIDQLDGTFFLFLKPQEGGKHMLTVKYGGEHVNGEYSFLSLMVFISNKLSRKSICYQSCRCSGSIKGQSVWTGNRTRCSPSLPKSVHM